jgi:hypothetical protein
MKLEKWGESYTSGAIFALQAAVEFYPVALVSRGLVSGLGLSARGFLEVGLQSRIIVGSTQNETAVRNTLLYDLELGLRYRWNILRRDISPVLKVGLDYGRHRFAIDYGPYPVTLPNVLYNYINFALVSLEVPFYTSRTFTVGATGAFDYMLVFSAGEIEAPSRPGYGRSSTGGIEVDGGLFFSFRGVFLRLNGFYRRFFYDFENACQPGCNTAGGALDIYAGGHASVGYAY